MTVFPTALRYNKLTILIILSISSSLSHNAIADDYTITPIIIDGGNQQTLNSGDSYNITATYQTDGFMVEGIGSLLTVNGSTITTSSSDTMHLVNAVNGGKIVLNEGTTLNRSSPAFALALTGVNGTGSELHMNGVTLGDAANSVDTEIAGFRAAIGGKIIASNTTIYSTN